MLEQLLHRVVQKITLDWWRWVEKRAILLCRMLTDFESSSALMLSSLFTYWSCHKICRHTSNMVIRYLVKYLTTFWLKCIICPGFFLLHLVFAELADTENQNSAFQCPYVTAVCTVYTLAASICLHWWFHDLCSRSCFVIQCFSWHSTSK